jgi:20S proteasome subunit alpha 4
MAANYDRAITIFSPKGNLFQVTYALEAVQHASTAVGVRGKNIIVLGVEKKNISKLQEPRTVNKLVKLDSHLFLAFAGLAADARVLINKARIECQSYRLTVEDAPSVELISRHIAFVQQQYTQKGGRRPFGISTLIGGFDRDASAHLYMTDPSGTYSEWKANVIGHNSKTVKEYLEKHYDEEVMDDVKQCEEAAIKLTCQALMEVVESGSKNIAIACMRPGQNEIVQLSEEELDRYVKTIQEEKEAAEAKK